MGEYAIRKSDGVRVKIGTCEEMYYLRYEDRFKVLKETGNVDPVAEANQLRFRLPFPDEDGVAVGEYEEFVRGSRLYRASSVRGCGEEFTDESLIKEPGSIQISHACGLLFSIPCYHGLRLPELGGIKTFWNGKSWFLELTKLRPTPEGVKPVVRCRWCGGQWRYSWSDIWDYVPEDLRPALRVYQEFEAHQMADAAQGLHGATPYE